MPSVKRPFSEHARPFAAKLSGVPKDGQAAQAQAAAGRKGKKPNFIE
jgi:hypothetical protein